MSEETKIRRAAAYIRLSREDGDAQESNSVKNQRALIGDFISEQAELRLCAEFVDDGFSGADFERPGFCAMLARIRSGEIDCVICKDLSRFGRNYIETGRYVERIFPFIGVRFIAINDCYDSAQNTQESDTLLLPFQNLVNDAYCRDISVKTRSQLALKREQGEFVGAFAAFGYRKAVENKNRLVPDDPAAQTVAEIFRCKLEGMSRAAIARRLDAQGIQPPAVYKRQQFRYQSGFETKADAGWSAVAVGRILCNPVYIGRLEQGKSTSPNFRLRQRIPTPSAEWTRTEQRHPAVVSKESFEAAQVLAQRRIRMPPPGEGKLAALLRCGECGGAMVRQTVPSGKKQYCYYICARQKAGGDCAGQRISAARLDQAVERALAAWMALCATPPVAMPTPLPWRLAAMLIRQVTVWKVKRVEMQFFFSEQIKFSGEEGTQDGSQEQKTGTAG